MKAQVQQEKAQETIQPKAEKQASISTILSEYNSPVQKKENKTGLPDNLKSGIENLSGHSMDDVKVHYGSSKPAELQAHAYAQGTNIHLAPGQEEHLPHEAWHVIQQKQGRVKPTMQMKGKVNVNDDSGLEAEADAMGARALSMKGGGEVSQLKKTGIVTTVVAQLKKIVKDGAVLKIVEDNSPLVAININAEDAGLSDDEYDAYYKLEGQLEEEGRLTATTSGQDRVKKEREAAEAEAARVEAARVEAARKLAAAKAAREKDIARFPLRASRKDNDFASKTNNRGQGKAHLLPTGLAAAGDVSIRPVDQLHQDHIHKGKSNLISFTGPNPIEGGQDYGGGGAPQIGVKFRKIARAKARNKPDVAHLDLHTSTDILAMKDTVKGFVKKDDEHQVRVRGGVIPKRMLVSSVKSLNLPDEHDSDSDSDAD